MSQIECTEVYGPSIMTKYERCMNTSAENCKFKNPFHTICQENINMVQKGKQIHA